MRMLFGFLVLCLLAPLSAMAGQDGAVQLTPQSVTPGTYGPCVSQTINSRGVITSIATVPCPDAGGGGGGGIGGSGTPGALARWLTPTTLTDSRISEAGDRVTLQNGNAPHTFLFASTWTDHLNWSGLVFNSDWFGRVAIFSDRGGSGQPKHFVLGTAGQSELHFFTDNTIRLKIYQTGQSDFLGEVGAPSLRMGIAGSGGQAPIHFLNNQTPFDTTLTGGAAIENQAYKLPVRLPTSNGQVLKCDTNGQMYWE